MSLKDLHQIAREIKLPLVNNVQKNISETPDRRNFESVRALLVLCTHVNANSFSADQKRVIFSRIWLSFLLGRSKKNSLRILLRINTKISEL